MYSGRCGWLLTSKQVAVVEQAAQTIVDAGSTSGKRQLLVNPAPLDSGCHQDANGKGDRRI